MRSPISNVSSIPPLGITNARTKKSGKVNRQHTAIQGRTKPRASGRSKRSTRHEEQKGQRDIQPNDEHQLKCGHGAAAQRGKQHNRQLCQLKKSQAVCAPDSFAQNTDASYERDKREDRENRVLERVKQADCRQ